VLSPELAPIYLRAHTRVQLKKKRQFETEQRLVDKWAHFALILDCETTIDIRQNLNFLWWRFCELKKDQYVCQLEGVAYADALEQSSVRVIRDSLRSRRADVEEGCPKEIRIQSRTEFVNEEFWDALVAGAAIVCFNAPFDLSRLALRYGRARNKNTGWTMVLWKEPRGQRFKPKLRIKPKDSRSAFISLAGGEPSNRVVYAGRFLDLSVLCWALRNQHLTLNGALESFGLAGKMDHEPTGLVTPKELAYGRKDVERTTALLNAMKKEYDGFPINLSPENAMSAASITKAFLDKMRVKRPAKKFKLDDEIQGKCMQAYYGGRSEIRIRHTEVPVVVCDATSEYPSVAALLKLWPVLTAGQIKIDDCTKEAQQTIKGLTSQKILDPTTWADLSFFALIEPMRNVLPVRSLYGDLQSEGNNPNIGVNSLTSDEPIWYAGPDLAAAALLGAPPKILKAFRIVPSDPQPGMKSVSIGSRHFNPRTDDFFVAVIEERKKLNDRHPHYLLLKIIANSLYGIFAELNKDEFGKNNAKQLDVFSGEHKFKQKTFIVEKPGLWQFAPLAALITAGGRLVLAILERMVNESGGTYLLTDTDSMLIVASKKGGSVPCACPSATREVKALTWRDIEEFCSRLNRLNPYDRDTVQEILKIEKCNYDEKGKQQQLYGLAVSAKRYVVYTRKSDQLEIVKPSEHGLGIVYVPDERSRYKPVHCQDQKTDYARWIVEVWESLLEAHFRNINDPEDATVSKGLWFGDFPAIMRIRVTTPNVLAALRNYDVAAGKPYNFAQSPILIDAPPKCTLIAPFSKHPEEWIIRNYTNIHDGDTLRLYDTYRGKKLQPRTLANIVWRHFLHPEAKSTGPDGSPCSFWTRGLLQRRSIKAAKPFCFIGKEIERKAQEGEDISAIESLGPMRYEPGKTKNTRAADPGHILRAQRFGVRQLIRESGVKQHAVERYLRGQRVHPSTRARILESVHKLEQRRK
jgi:hypothetical protein